MKCFSSNLGPCCFISCILLFCSLLRTSWLLPLLDLAPNKQNMKNSYLKKLCKVLRQCFQVITSSHQNSPQTPWQYQRYYMLQFIVCSLWSTDCVTDKCILYRGYYFVARSLWMLVCIIYSKLYFFMYYIHIFKLPGNVLFTIWSEVGTSKQRTNKSRRKTHTFFTRYIFLHIFSSENMTVLVCSKLPLTI